MIYVMSDIHGCYDEFMNMMDLIQLKEDDTLYILGDVVDRGNGSLQILDYIMSHKNIKMLLGNHEDLFLKWYKHKILKWFYFLKWHTASFSCVFYKQFKILTKEQQEEYVTFLKNCPLNYILTVNDNEYFLTHAGINCKENIHNQKKNDLLWISSKFILNENKSNFIIVFGHTPIRSIYKDYFMFKNGKLSLKDKNIFMNILIYLFPWFENKIKIKFGYKNFKIPEIKIMKLDKKIAIDCGCIYDDKLGCIRLDDMKEFYVDKNKNFIK